jgi:hypothetical protein
VPPARPDKNAEALRLRLAGFSYDDIALRLGYRNKSGAWKAVEKARDAAGIPADDAALELQRLDMLQRGLMTKALGGDVPAALAVVKIIGARARLSGLYPVAEAAAPQEVERRTDPVDDIAARRAARRAAAGS